MSKSKPAEPAKVSQVAERDVVPEPPVAAAGDGFPLFVKCGMRVVHDGKEVCTACASKTVALPFAPSAHLPIVLEKQVIGDLRYDIADSRFEGRIAWETFHSECHTGDDSAEKSLEKFRTRVRELQDAGFEVKTTGVSAE